MRQVIVIGGGAAGMMAAWAAARSGAQVDLYEKNEKTGKKIYITGKGRCNVTNGCEAEDFFSHVCSNPKFLYSSFYGFTNQDLCSLMEEEGCRLKTERGDRVFPVSDHASDVISAMNRAMKKVGVRVHLETPVEALLIEPIEHAEPENEKASKKTAKITGRAVGVLLAGGRSVKADAVIVCTGGLSYATTGSTGDGLKFARDAGLKVEPCQPSLVPMNVREADIPAMQGLSLKNVTLTIKDGKKCLYEGFGEMMFTHFGITGPLVLTASAVAGRKMQGKALQASIDLKPALREEQLDARLLREFEANPNKQLGNVLGAVLPAKMVPIMIARSQIPESKKVHDISRQERQMLLHSMKNFTMTIEGLRGYSEAIVTKGGVSVKQIKPDTMEVKTIPGLYFAGEVLDLDAVTGGFNLQIAWSTGYAAGMSAAMEEE